MSRSDPRARRPALQTDTNRLSGVTGKEAPTVWEVIAAIVPTNPVAAFANGEMLQIIFDVMPELHWTVGYPAALSLMLASGALPLWFFRRRGWI